MTHGSLSPVLKGGLLALLAAALFGLSTPFVQLLGRGLGPFTTAGLLYGGAGVVALLIRRPKEREAQLQRSDAGRLLAMALFGAVIGPVALAWGLQNTSGTSASTAWISSRFASSNWATVCRAVNSSWSAVVRMVRSRSTSSRCWSNLSRSWASPPR